MDETSLSKFVSDQLSVWPSASAAFRALKNARTKELTVGPLTVTVQHNPERIISTTAAADPEAVKKRPCFLCESNRPPEQKHLRFEGRKGRLYNIQVNPYPIFPHHLVIARSVHTPQSISHCYVDMLDLGRKYTGYTFFYNGPASGASAPDHMHFQAAPRSLMPLEKAVDEAFDSALPGLEYVTNVQEAELYRYAGIQRGVFALRARTAKSMAKLFYRFLDCAPLQEGESEPRFNLLTWYTRGEYRSIVVLRRTVRPHHFYSEGADHFTMSLGCADVALFLIAPVAQEFERIDARTISQMLSEVCITSHAEKEVLWRLTRSQRRLDVGIMSAKEIVFEIISDGAGPQKVSWEDGRINYNGVLYDELFFDAVTPSSLFAEASFVLHSVVIGKDFHWQRTQKQKFAGSLKFIVEGENITAVNSVGVEDYLLSVISSEMKASAPLEFLKAHAVISRSWLLSVLERGRASRNPSENERRGSLEDGTPLYIKWYDHDDHTLYDVCADDHCQRYQGLNMAVGENVRNAVDSTWGEVLTFGGGICDARFSKCCGGTTELFSTCWEDTDKPYLKAVEDAPAQGGKAFCDTSDASILSRVLNSYDRESPDFFSWEERFTPESLGDLIKERIGLDLGPVTALEALKRGPSGRISLLKITGRKGSAALGKELLIRRALSTTHLKSSAFEASFEDGEIVLRGRGWGHGVGLCQIGAAVMSLDGYSHSEILSHYYPGSKLERR